MKSNNTFTVPVGTRLSHGIELEMLIAYLQPNEADPDEAISSTLPPILRIDPIKAMKGDETKNILDATYEAIEEHVRTTLRSHGIRIKGPALLGDDESESIPAHLKGLDQWDITQDGSVTEEWEHTKGKIGRYQWFSAELRSPACWDVSEAYDEMGFVVSLLQSNYRVRLNPTCGFHVHVGNGHQYFRAETVKRAGAFLFAADPMLSRLHPPWRRVADYSTSIRYDSRLACSDGMGPAEAQEILDRYAEEESGDFVLDPIRVLPWSDRTREAQDFQGMANWEKYARARVRDGPHMTLSEIPSSPQRSQVSEASPSPQLTIRGGGGGSTLSATPSGSTSLGVSEDSEGGAHYRRLVDLMEMTGFRTRCLEAYGHNNPHDLSREELHILVVLDQCAKLLGNTNIDELSDSDFQKATEGCAPYLESVRSVWKWESSSSALEHQDAQFSTELEHPQPLGYNKLNASAVIRRLSAQASEIWERERALRSSTSYVVGDTNAVEPLLYDNVERLMEQPGFPLGNLDKIMDLWKTPAVRSNTGDQSPRAVSDGSSGGGGSNRIGSISSYSSSSVGSSDYDPPASKVLRESYPSRRASEAESSGKSHSSSHVSSSSSPLVNNTSVSDNPQTSIGSKPSSSSASSSSFVSEPSSSHHRQPSTSKNENENPKLLPHNISLLRQSYIDRVGPSMDMPPGINARLLRISWLPRPGGRGPLDPGEPHRRGISIGSVSGSSEEICREGCQGHVVTDTRTGIAALAAADSAAVVAVMLANESVRRLNYNFVAYELGARPASENESESEVMVVPKRTIEFREAAGSLDAEWVALWAKICVGILRFCRDAPVVYYLDVLERVVREEERGRGDVVGKEEEEEGEDVEVGIYDVCDLLDDMGLFAEATAVRRRERELGPPR